MTTSDRVNRKKITIGFVVLSHTQNRLLERLLSKLNQLYDSPPIVIHHDYSQAPFPISETQLTPNISLVKPHRETHWGGFSIVDAFLAGLEQLYQKHSPGWFANLSASCYPVATGSSVLTELARADYDALLGTAVLYPELKYPADTSIRSIGSILLSPSLPTYTSDVRTWMDACFRRYVATEQSGSLFGPTFGCFAGDQWFTANARAASVLLRSKRTLPDLVRHYSKVDVPDESFYQTVLCNEPSLRICECNRRFANWDTPGAHPLELMGSDFQRIVDSGCHFARKVSPQASGELLDVLDRWHLSAQGLPTALVGSAVS